eukprot:1189271-Prorocentrum_minimum.AAC.2
MKQAYIDTREVWPLTQKLVKLRLLIVMLFALHIVLLNMLSGRFWTDSDSGHVWTDSGHVWTDSGHVWTFLDRLRVRDR